MENTQTSSLQWSSKIAYTGEQTFTVRVPRNKIRQNRGKGEGCWQQGLLPKMLLFVCKVAYLKNLMFLVPSSAALL